MSRTIIELEDIFKRFYIGTPNELEVLHGISLKNSLPSWVHPAPESQH